jgi:hypothetical protein
VPQTSTKDVILTAEEAGVAQLPSVERARRRIGERYYDRPEIRRTLVSLLMRRVLARRPAKGAPEVESP